MTSKGHLHHWKTAHLPEDADNMMLLKCTGNRTKNFCMAELASKDKAIFTLIKTIDGGNTWNILSKSNQSLSALSCIP